ncbi:MAG: hypothetical protein JXR48_00200 [Candidatus Delongbacteria bacterium]|nr:hypothetical protein [Candidatus Delongbacteria bacterium]
MRKQGFMKDLSNVGNFLKLFLNLKYRFFRLELPIVLTTSLVILSIGFILSLIDFPMKDVKAEDIVNYPKDEDFMTASSYFKNDTKFEILDLNNEINMIYPELLQRYSTDTDIEKIKDHIQISLANKFKNKNVIIRRTDNIKLDNSNISLHSAKLENLNDEVDSLKKETSSLGPFTKKRFEKRIDDLMATIKAVDRLNGYIIELSVSPVVHYEKLNDSQSFEFIAGKLVLVDFSGTKYNCKLLNPKPVIANSFLSKNNSNFSANEADKGVYNSIKMRFEKIREDLIDQKYSAEMFKTKQLRNEYRKTFYGRLFSKLFFYITNYYAFILFLATLLILLKHLNKIGNFRKNKYFASEITVLAIKIISMITLIYGISLTLITTYIFIFTETEYNTYFSVLNLGAIFYMFPLIASFKLYLFSWIILLNSEFLRFLTNVYYLIQLKLSSQNKSID